MVNFRPILFVIGLVLSKIALFMYVPTLVAFATGTEALSTSPLPSLLPTQWLSSA